MIDYTVLAKFRNKEQVDDLIRKLRAKGRSCYNFCDTPADPDHPEADPTEQMRAFESVGNFYDDSHFRRVFEQDLAGLKNARTVIVLLPAGNSVHVEAGIAFGLGKKLVLIGKPEKPESLYLIFGERYDTVEEFLKTVR